MVKKLATMQAFGVTSPGGGPRILRALLADAPIEVMSVVTSIDPPLDSPVIYEVHAPPRRKLGRVDATRLRRIVDLVWRILGTRRYARRLQSLLDEEDVDAVHVVVHDASFAPAVRAAAAVDAKLYLTIHDDIGYNDPWWGRVPGRKRELADAWSRASERFVVSQAIGEEYCRRLGRAPYITVTDGVSEVPLRSREPSAGCAVYFAGLIHLSYEANFLALLAVLANRDVDSASLTTRSGSFPTSSLRERAEQLGERVAVLPFAPEREVARDIERADLLYLPLPFGKVHERLARLSLSTKFVTYVGSGVPILYHGPPYGTAYELLSAADAALCVTSLDGAGLTAALASSLERRRDVSQNALQLARRSFLLEEQRRRFWGAICPNGQQLS